MFGDYSILSSSLKALAFRVCGTGLFGVSLSLKRPFQGLSVIELCMHRLIGEAKQTRLRGLKRL